MTQHPDSPRPHGAEDDELTDLTRARQEDVGRPNLDEELDGDARAELGDDSRPGQNSDWLPQ